MIAKYQNCQYVDKKTEFVCEYANHYRIPILNRSWEYSNFLKKRCLKNILLLIIYVGISVSSGRDIVNNYENVYICTCNYLEFGTMRKW